MNSHLKSSSNILNQQSLEHRQIRQHRQQQLLTPLHVFQNTKDQSLTSSSSDLPTSQSTVWNPSLRNFMGVIASLGALETGYLTYSKLAGAEVLCTTNGQCASVLNGPWATVPYTQIPLSAIGFIAYATVAALSLAPVLSQDSEEDDAYNRIALLMLTTGMGTFSTFLITLLFNVLHQSCPFCLASATLSWTLAGSTWLGGALPPSKLQLGLKASIGSFASVTVATAALFWILAGGVSTPSDPYLTYESDTGPKKPPPVIASSTDRSLDIARELKALDARMFGAYWCPHCFDQKETLGEEALKIVPYVECAENGFNSQVKLCNSKKLPGYPTWEIAGKLYPGEKSLAELENIISEVKIVDEEIF